VNEIHTHTKLNWIGTWFVSEIILNGTDKANAGNVELSEEHGSRGSYMKYQAESKSLQESMLSL
jgi:hypothetical protein